jgi:hypothetical protein
MFDRILTRRRPAARLVRGEPAPQPRIRYP